ncbi:hypothetical protein AAV35_008310 [Salimicrobium jeotgali]|uniref:Uncharacterized protein n=1 Tax=Salimicrobium jeotgali TaxID=1230341 RepID=K2H3T9_9BACI|nr:hypothetical protein AAV35_008310 [Salimicrobium jeotgali]EKE30545.1 hypothetical protein MJ3_12754 [Salimicrobium jeotgali]
MISLLSVFSCSNSRLSFLTYMDENIFIDIIYVTDDIFLFHFPPETGVHLVYQQIDQTGKKE